MAGTPRGQNAKLHWLERLIPQRYFLLLAGILLLDMTVRGSQRKRRKVLFEAALGQVSPVQTKWVCLI